MNLLGHGVRTYAQVLSMAQFLQRSEAAERSHLHLDLRHWSQAVKKKDESREQKRREHNHNRPLLLLRRTVRLAGGRKATGSGSS